jgi:peptidoglycan pentaglycine glycine transferase (the first glycine)
MVECFADTVLSPEKMRRWEAFLTRAPGGTFRQSPRWAELERGSRRLESREPVYFRGEENGELVLVGLGMRRGLPFSPYGSYRFEWGPVFTDPAVLDEWLGAVLPQLRRDAVRVKLMPRRPLAEGGDDVETVLERHGFVRRRLEGGWATLLVDLTPEEDALLHTFRRQTRQNIKKCVAAGLCVQVEDGAAACEAMAGLYGELALRATLKPIPVQWFESMVCDWVHRHSGGGVFIARRDGLPVAGAVVFVDSGVAYLDTIASNGAARALPTNSLLVWEIMRWAKRRGCSTFDLCGYSLVARPGEALAGVNQFKRGFAPHAEPVRYVASHDLVIRPALEALCTAGIRAEACARRALVRAASRPLPMKGS